MEDNSNSVAPAIAEPDNVLTILREVSHAYETFKDLRKRTARVAQQQGHTYQELGDALGINRSNAHKLIHRDAA